MSLADKPTEGQTVRYGEKWRVSPEFYPTKVFPHFFGQNFMKLNFGPHLYHSKPKYYKAKLWLKCNLKFWPEFYPPRVCFGSWFYKCCSSLQPPRPLFLLSMNSNLSHGLLCSKTFESPSEIYLKTYFAGKHLSHSNFAKNSFLFKSIWVAGN